MADGSDADDTCPERMRLQYGDRMILVETNSGMAVNRGLCNTSNRQAPRESS